jgi:hypothetical protein
MFKLIPIKDDNEKVFIEFNGERVGKLNYYFTEKIVMINYILIFDEYKRKGIATKFIKYIKSCHTGKILYGDALPDAIKFWDTMGVKFDTPFPSKLRPDILLTPFQLKC